MSSDVAVDVGPSSRSAVKRSTATTEPAIRVESLSKRYRLGGREQPYKTFRDAITGALSAPVRFLRRASRSAPCPEVLWALRDVDFEVESGEVVGIIGGNGAGKSTLLKVLARVTSPTTGSVRVRGRLASLLEVGTGFHPELTGRENIYLNGAILGMTRHETRRKFDEIVAFAQVETFIDTPIKRYSSGMQMRLAFAVAVHLEPEILIVDEVLAVGDAQFQKKCLEKMRQLSRSERTILFVSHNLAAVRQICHRGLALEAGWLVDQGDVNDVVDRYLLRSSQADSIRGDLHLPSFTVHDVRITSENGPVIKTFDPIGVRIRYSTKVDALDPSFYVGFLTLENERLAGLEFRDFRALPPIRAGRTTEVGFNVECFPLMPGGYQLEIQMKDMASGKVELLPRMLRFEVVESPVYGGRKTDHWFGRVGLRASAVCADAAAEASGEPPCVARVQQQIDQEGPRTKARNVLPPRTEILRECPVCSATVNRRKLSSPDFLHGVPGSYSYVTCFNCGSVYQNPSVVVDDLSFCYPPAYYTHEAPNGDPATMLPASGSLRGMVRRAVLHRADCASGSGISKPMKYLGAVLALIPAVRRRARFGLIDSLATSGRGGNRCLEVGPGQGQNLLRLKWIGWSPVGLDIDPAAADIAQRSSGCEVKVGSLRDADFSDSSFDLIFMNHVLEHLPDLAESLRRCHQLLRPGGRIVLIYPNPESLGGRAEREYSPIWDPPRHLVLPTCEAIVGLLRRLRFDQVESSTSAKRAAAYRAVARQYRRGFRGIGLVAGVSTIGDLLFAFFESLLVAVGLNVGEEIVVVALRAEGGTI
jgi:lipopolysaccharide transport system ATP-binding protein